MIPKPSSLTNSVALVPEVVPSLLMTAYPTIQPLTPLKTTAPGIKLTQKDVGHMMTMTSLLMTNAAAVTTVV
jgi:hypothetical protein